MTPRASRRACSPGRRAELEAGARAGRVRDGHGDLRAEHVVLEHGIEVVDCVEFDPALREHRLRARPRVPRDGPRAAATSASPARSSTAYRDAGGDPGDDALLAFFAAQRALIRAKVALVRAGQVSAARTHAAQVGRGRAPAAGRAPRLARPTGPSHRRMRHRREREVHAGDRAGGALPERRVRRPPMWCARPSWASRARPSALPPYAYTAEANRRTYAALGDKAAELVAAGERVVVDATFRFAADRRAFTAALGPAAEDAVWLECRAPERLRLERAAARMRDTGRISDADPAVAARQREEWEPLEEVPCARRVVVDTDRTPAAVLRAAAAALDDRGRATGSDRSQP